MDKCVNKDKINKDLLIKTKEAKIFDNIKRQS